MCFVNVKISRCLISNQRKQTLSVYFRCSNAPVSYCALQEWVRRSQSSYFFRALQLILLLEQIANSKHFSGQYLFTRVCRSGEFHVLLRKQRRFVVSYRCFCVCLSNFQSETCPIDESVDSSRISLDSSSCILQFLGTTWFGLRSYNKVDPHRSPSSKSYHISTLHY